MKLNSRIETVKNVRLYLLEYLKDLTAQQLNEIPDGFNNNIIWNLGHLVSSQQGVCYVRAGLDVVVEERYFLPYRPGTKPAEVADEQTIAEIKGLMLSTIVRFEKDYQNNLFNNYTSWVTRYGVQLDAIEDAVNFIPFHEGFHVGYITALKRTLKS